MRPLKVKEAEIVGSKHQITELKETIGNLKLTNTNLQKTNDKIVLEISELKEVKEKDQSVQAKTCAIQWVHEQEVDDVKAN